MNRFSDYFRARAAALLLAALLPVGFVALAQEPAGDPLPLTRVLVAPEQLPAKLESVKNGVLVQMPRARFDKLLTDAARKSADAKKPPRLVEARYRATLQKEPALVGTGQWKTVNPTGAPALLPLTPLNLALRQARWENSGDARPDALLADFDGKNPALLLEQAGEHALALDWSARADVRPEGVYFKLEFPPAPVAVLELNLPADHFISAEPGVALSGPYPAEMDNRRLWKISGSGQPGVAFWVHRAADIAAPLAFVSQQTTQKLTPDGQEALFQFDLDLPRPGVRFLEFQGDPELRPYEATGPGGEALPLRTFEGAMGQPARFVVALPEPLPVGSTRVSVRCLAPLGPPVKSGPRPGLIAWTSPSLRLVQVGSRDNAPEQTGRAVLRDESLTVLAHPDVHLDSWQPGAFRLLETATKNEGEPVTAFQMLKLSGGAVEPDGVGKRPKAHVLAGGVEFRARQAALWQLAADQTSLTLQIAYEVHHGQLFQLPVQLPPGWDIDHVEVSLSPSIPVPSGERGRGEGALRTWTVRQDYPDKGKTTLLVDLQHPLTADDAKRDRPAATPFRPRGLTLTVRLHPLRPAAITGREMPFPDAIPLGARVREGSLGIAFDEQTYQPIVKTLAMESEPDEEASKQELDFYYSYRGQPVTGTLLLRPRAPQVRAKCSSEVFLASGRAAVETRLLLEAETGNVERIDIAVSTEDGTPWEWRVEQGDNQIRRVERLTVYEARDAAALLGVGQPLATAALAGARPRGERWRITFTRPLRPRAPLVLRADRPLDPTADRYSIPLLVVLRASRMEGEATLHLAGGDRVQIESLGLREAAGATGQPRGRAGPWRTFRYGELPVGLTLLGRSRGSDRAVAVIEDARLTTYVAVDGSLQVHFQFQASHWPRRTLPVTLPAGAQPLAAQVDGHWLPQLSLSDVDGGSALDLPVPAHGGLAANEAAHQFIVVYTLPGQSSFAWRRAVSPVPKLPVAPLQVRQTWRLPPGVRPLKSNYRRLPDPTESSDFGALRATLAAKLGQEAHEDAAVQMQALADACQAVRQGQAGQTLPLRKVLELVRIQAGRDLHGIVLDALALEEAGIGPETPVTLRAPASNQDQTPPWAALGLVAIPARVAPLLTTLRQGEVWPAFAGSALDLPEAVEASVAEALVNGHDSTGRFVLALEWYGDVPDGARVTAAVLSPALANWTEWEALPGIDPGAGVTLVRGDTVTAAAVLLAALLALIFWRLWRRSIRTRLTFLMLWLAVAGVALVWLPPALRPLALWPLPLGCAFLIGWYILALRREPPRKAPKTVVAVAATAAAILVALFSQTDPTQALAPEPATVYIVPGPPEQPDDQTVLVTPELLAQIEALAKPASAAPGGAVLLSATYEGKVVDGAAEFHAVFQAFCPSKGAELAIPLDGVRLVDDVWLDGARALPTALPKPQTGFALKVSGAGVHKIELRFRAPITTSDEDCDLQFTAPRLLQSRLRLELPPAASFAQAISRSGAETLTTTPAGTTLSVDLGRLTGPVHLHWLEEPLPPAPVKVRYKEAYSWDLRPDAARLDGLVLFDVYQGNARTLNVRLPADLEVYSVEPRRPEGGGAVRLESWRVRDGANGERVLRMRFPSPVHGELLVGLKCVAAAPLSSRTPLPLPVPQGSLTGEGGYVAYQARGLDVRANPQKMRPIKPDDFAPFWPSASRPNAAAFAHAYAFRHDGGAAPALRVQILPPPPTVQAAQDVRLRVDGRLARFRAAVELTAPQNDLSLAEWQLIGKQPVTVAGVSGAGVRCWSQSGNRLLVWLEKTAGSAKLEIFGWLPLAQPADGPSLELPCFRLVGAQTQQTTVRVAAGAGQSVVATRLANLLPLSGSGPGDPDLAYTSKQATYEGTFQVRPAAASAKVSILTFVEVVERQVRFTTTIDYRIKEGELRAVQIRLRDWEGEDVTLDAANVLQKRERRRGRDDRTWTLDLRPGFTEPFRATWGLAAGLGARQWRHEGVTGSYRVTLHGELPVEEAVGGMPAPQVSVAGVDAKNVERWLAVAGPELGVEGVFDLKAVPNTAAALKPWPGAADRLRRVGGRVWQATTADGTLRLLPQDHAAESAPIQVFLREHSAAVADNQHWLHEAVYWLRHEAHTDLNLTFPTAARVISVSLDGVETPPVQPEPSRLWLPLPGRAGVRCMRLRWVYDPPEPLDRPTLDAPKLEGADEGPCLWTVHVPPGYDVSGWASGLKPGLGRAAWADLQRADAQLQILRRLLDPSAGSSSAAAQAAQATPLRAAQRRFLDLCRQAERTLAVSPEASGETGPGGITLREWLQQQRTQYHDLTTRAGLDEPPPAEESHATAPGTGALPRRGVPLYGLTDADVSGPSLRLTAEAVHREHAALLGSLAWLGVLVFVWWLSFFPALLPWGRRFAPEQFALAGGAVWLAGWPLLVALVLLLVAGLIRIFRIGAWIAPYLRRHTAAPLTASAKIGSGVHPPV